MGSILKKSSLGLVEFGGSKNNNIILDGPKTRCCSPFRDGNPHTESDAVYKAVAFEKIRGGLYAYKSVDGMHWTIMADEPVITETGRSTRSIWSSGTRCRSEYREYHRDTRPGKDSRGNVNGRDIKTSATKDFLNWPEPAWLNYSPGRISELYTNGVLPYYRAPHIFLASPPGMWIGAGPSRPLRYRNLNTAEYEHPGRSVSGPLSLTVCS